ncbi:uncharacterized protein LOC131698606 [Acipenser ruthenus]|uniref:uncharacterized protein LOC131698606 n=1 Tax=Acipenser ruthenus TaxID=7906 RepID=UPI00145BA966|nr:uncharacterized protein LOC131698606 [Acipenser ruthenus]
MDASPAISLSFLYKNDPIYSLCAPDLMTASQAVNNNFIKEQKKLMQTLKRLDHQKLTRMRQMNEEKKLFAHLMKKKLAPTSRLLLHAPSGSSTVFTADRIIRTALSTNTSFTVSDSRKSTAKSSDCRQSSAKHLTPELHPTFRPDIQSGDNSLDAKTRKLKVSQAYFMSTIPLNTCKCGRSSNLLTRSESCLPVLQSHVGWEET